MNIEYIQAKTMILKTKSQAWFGCDYNMNIYRGCSHGCIYCDSRSECYRNDDFEKIKVKKDALSLVENELRKKIKTGVIGTGAMSDPYNPLEEKLLLTRDALKLIDKYNFGVAIDTKSPLITRDIDILKEINKHSPVIAKITITTFDDKLCKEIEPNVASTSERFKAIKTLSQNGIYCGILLMPILPFINDSLENIKNIINHSKKSGVKFIYPFFGMTLRDRQRSYFYEKLDRLFPSLKEKYIKMYGNNYQCNSPNYKQLYEFFKKSCKENNIKYNMKYIIDDYKGYKKKNQHEQLNFFT